MSARATPESLYDAIQAERAKYPPGSQSAVLPALRLAQDEYGWLSPDALREVADALDRCVRGLGPVRVVLVGPEETRAAFEGLLSSEVRAALLGWAAAEAHTAASGGSRSTTRRKADMQSGFMADPQSVK